MREPTLLFCVGATKAGTSWLYRMLHNHPQCDLPDVKEAHYWDTFNAGEALGFANRLAARADELSRKIEKAEFGGNTKWAGNMKRHRASIEGLAQVVTGNRSDHGAYLNWLGFGRTEAQVIADMTPSYALLSEDELRQMIAVRQDVKVIYLVRDPFARLWSHVRMAANRQGQDVQSAANDKLTRIVAGQGDRSIVIRGDYRDAIQKLRTVVPAQDLLIEYTEDMLTPAGWARICEFLNIEVLEFDPERQVHKGETAKVDPELVGPTIRFLKDQYDWVAANVGPLPQQWQDNLARANA